ncbi:MAG: AAA family ATPase [Planctomycetota bacterium]|nr:ATP-binding protein [bacterium]
MERSERDELNSFASTIFLMMGRTAAGKTSLAKYVSRIHELTYISESAVKMSLVTEYSNKNSLDEHLRDRGYRKAIGLICEERLPLVIDASFHKAFRRKWLYRRAKALKSHVVILYVLCSNTKMTFERIAQRQSMTYRAETLGNTEDIYHHVHSGFEELSNDEIPADVPAAYIKVDTAANKILYHCCTCQFSAQVHERLLTAINAYLSLRSAD